eukprot:PhF_6_TR40069/c0_g1_i1/m.59435
MERIPVLYTKHRTQKNKVWHDGFVEFQKGHAHSCLRNAETSSILSSVTSPLLMTMKDPSVFVNAFEGFLIDVGDWQPEFNNVHVIDQKISISRNVLSNVSITTSPIVVENVLTSPVDSQQPQQQRKRNLVIRSSQDVLDVLTG